jgi:hypothetical protein
MPRPAVGFRSSHQQVIVIHLLGFSHYHFGVGTAAGSSDGNESFYGIQHDELVAGLWKSVCPFRPP